MAGIGSKGIIRYVETFATDSISTSGADGVGWFVSSDSGDTAIARAVAAGKGLHATGATSVDDNNLIEFCGDTLMFAGQEGFSAVEVLLQLDDVTNVAFNFGLNDDVNDASNTLPAELSGTTWTANAATFVGLVYDVDATNDDLHCFWVDDSSATSTAIADLRMQGVAPANAKWFYMKVEMQDRGSGNGVRVTLTAQAQNGNSVSKTFNTTVDRDCPLCWYLGIENRSGTAHNVYIKAPAWEQSIADM